MQRIKVIGGGLAGVEATYQLAKRGIKVDLYEMRPNTMTEAHKTSGLAELVCSNSLKSEDLANANGLLKEEMKLLDSFVLQMALKSKVASGGALSVDREKFSLNIENELQKFPNVTIIREEVSEISDYTIVASGPLTSEKLTKAIIDLTGKETLSFFDAVAPIIELDSVNKDLSYWASRYDKGDADYLNCPLDKETYIKFVEELIKAQRVNLRDFEKKDIFNACMPVELMAERGIDTLRFGPLKPVGLRHPKTGESHYAVVQLRKEDNFNQLCNLVGFQTNLKFGEQERIFKMIPALSKAKFVRYGVMHRNTFVNSPILLDNGNRLRQNENIYFAGQITGVEGYMESAMSGLIAGINFAMQLNNKDSLKLPPTTASGSLIKYISSIQKDFQPMHVNFSLIEPLEERVKSKHERKLKRSQRAIEDLKEALKRGNYA